jgi:hypothetical protein
MFHRICTAFSARAVGILLVTAGCAMGQTAKPAMRVGVYDSRAIAVAYAQSELFRQEMAPMMADFERAKAAKDEKQVKELEARGQAGQARLHQQGFSTGSVLNIMDRLKAELPGIAAEAKVAMIVSKWEVVHRDPTVELVDVTMPLVMKFKPSEQTLKMVEQMENREPIPIEQLPSEPMD